MDKIDQETAEAEFERFAKGRRLLLEVPGMDENEARDNGRAKYLVIQGIMDGNITIDENFALIFSPYDSELTEPLVFARRKGDPWLSMDKKKETAGFGKLIVSVAAMTKQAPKTISNLEEYDHKIVQAVWMLLML